MMSHGQSAGQLIVQIQRCKFVAQQIFVACDLPQLTADQLGLLILVAW